jgi:hypothetical protein
MAVLTLTITDAGRQALVDAENTGTLPVKLSAIALGSGNYTPAPTQTALQTEVKRITTFGGATVADDTLHITITDDSTDTYSLGEFGVYTDGGVLFGVYSQATPIIDKAADASVLLSVDVVLTTVDPGSVTVGGTEFMLPPATTTREGVVELADDTEAKAKADGTRVLTPKNLAALLATETMAGFVEAATSAEAKAGTAGKFPDAAGVLAAVRQFGLGRVSTPARLANLDDPNKATGFYEALAGTGNTAGTFPPGENFGLVLHFSRQHSDQCSQIFFSDLDQKIYWRNSSNTDGGAIEFTEWVQIWTTGNLEKTQSSTDTTAGRMLKVGDGGVLERGPLVDIDDPTLPAMLASVSSSHASLPIQQNGLVRIERWSDTATVQRYMPYSFNEEYMRNYVSGSWSPWVLVWHSGNLKNPVDIDTLFSENFYIGGQNVDYNSASNWWTTISTSTTQGGTPGNYVTIHNLGAVADKGMQIASHYGANDDYYLRRKSDNASSPNGAGAWQPWRRIWHNANLPNPVQNGDWGIGGEALELSDWNTSNAAGCRFLMGYNATNAPVSGWMIGRYERHNASYGVLHVAQFTGHASGASRSFYRVFYNSTWQGWQEVVTDKNFGDHIGSVSTGGIGSYALLKNKTTSSFQPGQTTAGSNLCYTDADGYITSTATVSGTWRCMGYVLGTGEPVEARRTTVWLRIS